VLENHITLNMRRFLSVGLAAILTSQAIAGDEKWLSPVYTEIYQNPLPFPPDKAVL
jgi:bilirubin oxidase